MRGFISLTAAVVMLALAGCVDTASTQGSTPSGEPTPQAGAVQIPDDFPVLEPPELADGFMKAMAEAGEVTVDVTTVVGTGDERLAVSMNGVLNWRSTSTDADLTLQMQGTLPEGSFSTAVRLILVDGVAFLQGVLLEDFGVSPPALADWVRVADDEPGVPEELRTMIDEMSSQQRPETTAEWLMVTSHLRPLDVERRGVAEVIRYEGTIEVADALEVASEPNLRGVLEQFSARGVSELTYEILVDRDNLLREFTVDHSIGDYELSSKTVFHNWGLSRTITAPDEHITWTEAAG